MIENIRGRRIIRFDPLWDDQEDVIEVYYLCDGNKHLRVTPSVKRGFMEDNFTDAGGCDNGSPHGQPVDPYDLESRLQYEFGISLDRRFDRYGVVSEHSQDYRISRCSPNILESDRHIMEREEAVVIKVRGKKFLANVFGKKPFDASMQKPEPLKIQAVKRKLQKMDLPRGRRIAVLATATPRYAIQAATWGQSVRELINRDLNPEATRDQIFAALQAFCLCPSLGREKAKRILRGFGIETPVANSERAFFMILDGAKEILALDDPYLMFT